MRVFVRKANHINEVKFVLLLIKIYVGILSLFPIGAADGVTALEVCEVPSKPWSNWISTYLQGPRGNSKNSC